MRTPSAVPDEYPGLSCGCPEAKREESMFGIWFHIWISGYLVWIGHMMARAQRQEYKGHEGEAALALGLIWPLCTLFWFGFMIWVKVTLNKKAPD
jgi:hypothetical protein